VREAFLGSEEYEEMVDDLRHWPLSVGSVQFRDGARASENWSKVKPGEFIRQARRWCPGGWQCTAKRLSANSLALYR
jgi:hypothetical protein